MKHLVDRHRIKPKSRVDLNKIPTRGDGIDKDKAHHQLQKMAKELADLQELMYAENKHALLIVLQAMDAGGKDSTIREVLSQVNPQGCRVHSFKGPSSLERSHDFLWRIHKETPERGMICVFNRSHYEDVGIVRVKELAPDVVWKKRYDHINAFEKMLSDEGTTIVKFFLHISKDYQKLRLQRRLDRADKLWKFSPDDLAERGRWDAYMKAYNEAISRCTTKDAPWYVIPSERRWYRDWAVTSVLVNTLRGLKMKYPEPTIDPTKFTVE
ncbi:MAG: polyphosphate kinase 2 family protein [Planctomycetes bacterium]|nr:polyphosphate kinase 2 family protein [Planctomycetota bacterium]